MTDWNPIAGEDATLLYMAECLTCGTIVLVSYADEESMSPAAKFCPICDPQEEIPFLDFLTIAQLGADRVLRDWVKQCRKSGVVW